MYFEGSGGVLVVPPKLWSHAVRNDGKRAMWIVAMCDMEYDRHQSDDVRRDAIHRLVTDDVKPVS
jgi:hypothetical protein